MQVQNEDAPQLTADSFLEDIIEQLKAKDLEIQRLNEKLRDILNTIADK